MNTTVADTSKAIVIGSVSNIKKHSSLFFKIVLWSKVITSPAQGRGSLEVGRACVFGKSYREACVGNYRPGAVS